MSIFKVCFIGVGSIARRHIRNLTDICNKRGIKVVIDVFRICNYDDNPLGVNCVYNDINEVPDDYDSIFITNPTSIHLDTLEKFSCKGRNFFIEKPVVSFEQIERARTFKVEKEKKYYVACPLRYNSVIRWIKENIDINDVISIRSISSSYLPEWRPKQDYRLTYSAKKNMGGGVSVDLIHEWDYISYIFGWPVKLYYLVGKKSELEIDSDDYAIYIAEYSNMTVELHLDYYGRKTIRQIQLFTKDDTIVGDISNNTIFWLVSGRELSFAEERDDYQKRELIHFLDIILGVAPNDSSFEHGLKVLELTKGIL